MFRYVLKKFHGFWYFYIFGIDFLFRFKIDRKTLYLSKFISIYHIAKFDHSHRVLLYSLMIKMHFKSLNNPPLFLLDFIIINEWKMLKGISMID